MNAVQFLLLFLTVNVKPHILSLVTVLHQWHSYEDSMPLAPQWLHHWPPIVRLPIAWTECTTSPRSPFCRQLFWDGSAFGLLTRANLFNPNMQSLFTFLGDPNSYKDLIIDQEGSWRPKEKKGTVLPTHCLFASCSWQQHKQGYSTSSWQLTNFQLFILLCIFRRLTESVSYCTLASMSSFREVYICFPQAANLELS